MKIIKIVKDSMKLDIYKVLLISVASLAIYFSFDILKQKDILEYDEDGLARIEYISANVQRVSKLALEGTYDFDLLHEINQIAVEFANKDRVREYFEDNDDITNLMQEFGDEFGTFIGTVIRFCDNGDRDMLFYASEYNYEISTSVISSIQEHIRNLALKITYLEKILIATVIIAGVLLIKILMDTMEELKKNKELSKDMFIDASTGLYNRAKCQEVLKTPIDADNPKHRAIIIFDLNDLKKTNDNLGHRAGDDLIASFGAELKSATNISKDEIFVGRYGGDEFMAYFASCEEEDVKAYIEETERLMTKFNESGAKEFNLSCAAGYGITTKDTKDISMRDLFDNADENMYNNKIAMKEKKKQELLDRGIEVIDVVDDRL